MNKKIVMFKVLISISVIFTFLSKGNASILEVGTGKKYPTIQSAIDVVTAGDTINIYSGLYKENIVVKDILGTQGNPITLKPVENGVIVDADLKGTGIYLDRVEWWVIGSEKYSMEIRNGYGGNTLDPDYTKGGGIVLRGCKYTTVNNVTISTTVTYYGILGPGQSDQTVGDILVRYGHHNTIKNCKLTSKWSDVNLEAGGGGPLTIRGNILSNGIRYPLKVSGVSSSIIEKNYISAIDHSTFPPGVATEDGILTGYIRESAHHTIRYNIFDAGIGTNREEALTLFDDANYTGSEAHMIYNNVFINGKHSTVSLGNIQDSEFFNNIFINKKENSYCVKFGNRNAYGNVFDYNIYDCQNNEDDSNGIGLNNYRTLGAKNKSADPKLFESGALPIPYFQPQPESPAIGAGLAISGFEGTDFAGVNVPSQAPDIGPLQASPEAPVQDTIPPQPPILLAIE
ncbi:MAG: hypothetical protein GTO02_16205 [Candidatus Dadabacteria bacterium]|nr:hypothetical protein [Candidatus Dadabacteria bacterium]